MCPTLTCQQVAATSCTSSYPLRIPHEQETFGQLAFWCVIFARECREAEGAPPDDFSESDDDAVQQQQRHQQQVEQQGSSTSPLRGSTHRSGGSHDPLGDLTWPLETSKTVSRGASSQLLSLSQGVSSSAAAAAAAAGAGISSLLAGASRGKSAERQRAATLVSLRTAA